LILKVYPSFALQCLHIDYLIRTCFVQHQDFDLQLYPYRSRQGALLIAHDQPNARNWFSNRWRLAFFALLALILAAIIALIATWFSITEPKQAAPASPPPSAGTPTGMPIEANVTVESLNQFLALQLAKKETPVKDAKFAFENGRVRSNASLYFFGRTMNMTMWTKPEVLDNGDLRLVAEDVTMGSLPIPLKTLFAVLEGVPWPSWVHVQSEQRTIDFKFSERPSDTDFRYRIKKIDWPGQRIQMEIVPTLPETPKK
jgi:uncharacterized protein YpmS